MATSQEATNISIHFLNPPLEHQAPLLPEKGHHIYMAIVYNPLTLRGEFNIEDCMLYLVKETEGDPAGDQSWVVEVVTVEEEQDEGT